MSQLASQTISVSLYQEDYSKLIHIIETYGQSKGEEWVQWASQIIQVIQKSIESNSPTDIVSIKLKHANWNKLKNIVQETCQSLDTEWQQYASRIAEAIEDGNTVPKWEYLTLSVLRGIVIAVNGKSVGKVKVVGQFLFPEDGQPLYETLNRLGQEGWEVVGISPNGMEETGTTIVLKRQLYS